MASRMQALARCVSLAVAALAMLPARGADFQNLDFEQTTLTPTGAVLTAWALGFDGPSANGVLGPAHNNICLGSRCISVHDAASPFFRPLEGRFSTLIQGGSFASGDTFISQIGTIPIDAGVVRLLAYGATTGNAQPLQQLQVLANGIVLPVISPPLTTPNAVIAGIEFDVAAFAGQLVELRIAALNRPNTDPNILIDAIAFSVPEPSHWRLLLVGLIGLWFAAGRRYR